MKNNLRDISLLIQNKNFSEAIESLKNLDQSEKDNPNYYFLRGVSYLYLNNLNFAI